MASSFYLFICVMFIAAFSTADPSTPIIPSSYTHHCSSIVPVSSPTHPITIHHSLRPYLNLTTPYFNGGDQLLPRKIQTHQFFYGQKSILLQHLPISHQTLSPEVYMIQAILHVSSPYIGDYNHVLSNLTYRGTFSDRCPSRESVRFSFTGFWSETSRKACMVGSAYPNFGEGGTQNFSGVLKLKYVSEKWSASIRSSLISGTLESMSSTTDPGYFDSISMFSFPDLPHYNYSLLSEEISILSGSGVAKSRSLSLDATLFCNRMSSWGSTFFEMEYSGNCAEPEQCSPLGNSVLPQYLSLMPIQCSMNEKKIRYVVRFMNESNLVGEGLPLESSLIAEAVWDNATNQLFIGACRMLNPIDHFDDPIGECGIRLSVRFPSALTIRSDSMVVGELWSKGSEKEKGYFRKIELSSNDRNNVDRILGQTHEYTEMSRVLKSCPVENTMGEGKIYPDGKSGDMKFNGIVQNSKGEKLGVGYATPVFVGEELYQSSVIAMGNMSEVAVPIRYDTNIGARLSVSYISYKIIIQPFWSESNSGKRISKLNMSLSRYHQVEISAEGTYNVQTGQLCMVGCTKSWNLANISKDSEILLKFEFSPLNARKGDRIKGTIVSTRREDDPLHFENLTLSAAAFYTRMAERSVQ